MSEEKDNGITGITTHYSKEPDGEFPHQVVVKLNGVKKKVLLLRTIEQAQESIEEWRQVARIIEACGWARWDAT